MYLKVSGGLGNAGNTCRPAPEMLDVTPVGRRHAQLINANGPVSAGRISASDCRECRDLLDVDLFRL